MITQNLTLKKNTGLPPVKIGSYIYAALVLIYALVLLFIPERWLWDTIIASVALNVAAALWMIFRGEEIVKTFLSDRVRMWILTGLSVLFALMFSAEQLLLPENFDYTTYTTAPGFGFGGFGYYYVRILAVPLLLISSCILLSGFVYVMASWKKREQSPDIAAYRKQKRVWMLVMILFAAAFLLAQFPFRPSADSWTMWNGIRQNIYVDWHTIGYEFFCILCIKLFSFICEHPFSVCIVQTVIWIVAVGQLFDTVYLYFPNRRAVRLLGILCVVFFQPVMYLGVMFKDTIFSICILGMTTAMLRILKKGSLETRDMVSLILYASGCAMFRHAAVIAVAAALAILMGKLLWEKRTSWLRGILVVLIPVAALVTVNLVGIYGFNMGKNPAYIKYSVPLYMVAGFVSEEPEIFNDGEAAMLEEFMPLEDWKEAYESDPYWADTVSREYTFPGPRINMVDDAYGFRIVKMNAKLLLRSPFHYVRHLLDITSILWEITEPAGGETWISSEFYSDVDRMELESDGMVRDDLVGERLVTVWNYLTVLMNAIEYFFIRTVTGKTIWFRGGIWLFLTIASAIAMIHRRQAWLIVAYAPVLILTLLYFLSIPSQDFRYVLPMMQVGLWLIVYLLCGGNPEQPK